MDCKELLKPDWRTMIISLLFLMIFVSGCIEEKPTDKLDGGEPPLAGPRTIYVDDNNEGPWFEGSQEDPYQSIQDALDDADDGDTVFVYNGIYEGYSGNEIYISKSIHLIGEKRDKTIIIDNSDCNNALVYVNAPNVTIENLSVCSLSRAVPPAGQTGILIISDVSTIRNCRFNTSKIGIHIISSYNLISNCIFDDSNDEGIALFGHYNKVENCMFHNNGDGIELAYNCSHNTISNCGFYKSSHCGLAFITGANNNSILNCSIFDSESGGIQVSSSHHNLIFNCVSHNSTYGEGICIRRSSGNKIVSCELSNNRGGGIEITDASDNQIYRCNIYNNVGCGIAIYFDSDNNVVHHNNLIRNSLSEEQVRDTGINQWDDGIDEGNYWGNYEEVYPNAMIVDGVWYIPYAIAMGENQDRFPLVDPVDI